VTGTLKDRSRLKLLRKNLGELALLTFSALLFALSFPGFHSDTGWGLLVFLSLAPAVPVIRSSSWIRAPFYGAFYGFVSYAIFNYWLSTFHPLAILIVPIIYAVYFILLFPVLKAADVLFPRYSYIVQAVIWVAYEYLRTQGFLAYPYGNLGYALYKVLPMIQVAELAGVWGVSFFIALVGFFIGHQLIPMRHGLKPLRGKTPDIIVIAALFTGILVFGLAAPRGSYDDQQQWKVALVQHNADTWKGGLPTYRRNLETMIALSEEALTAHDPDVVVWSETAFVPGVDWHSRYRTDAERYALVQELRAYLEDKEVPFVIGNDDGQLADPLKPPVLADGSMNRVDYNAIFLYEEGGLRQTYRKTHLVPFTENFPYKDTFPRFYQLLVDNDYHFWERGTEYTVFETKAGVRFSTPICFEDIFGYLNRRFVQEGAEIIVNLTNDSWSGSVAAQMQHMSMAVFRAVELRRSVVRSGNSGMTCTIDPDGRITGILEPFVEDYFYGTVPIYTDRNTLYYRWGDWYAQLMLILALLLLSGGAVLRLRSFLRRR
jgi:apolipoprotein N-acyltransferase